MRKSGYLKYRQIDECKEFHGQLRERIRWCTGNSDEKTDRNSEQGEQELLCTLI